MTPDTGDAFVSDLVVIFTTRSDVEASIVRGLLEAHGVRSHVSTAVTHSVFPVTVNELGEVRISRDRRGRRRGAADHRQPPPEQPGGQLVRLRDEFDSLQRAIEYRFRDRGLLEHAMTHTSRANEDLSGGVADNESLEFLGDAVLGFLVADLLFHQFPTFDEGQKSKVKASLVSTATLARQAERLALGDQLLLGRGEEKTGGRQQAGAAGRRLRIADCGDLPRRRHRAGARVHRARVRAAARARCASTASSVTTTSRRCRSTCSRATGRCRSTGLTGTTGPDHRKQFLVELVVDGRAAGARRRGRARKKQSRKPRGWRSRNSPRRLAAQEVGHVEARRLQPVHQSISIIPQAFLSSSAGARRSTMARAGSAVRQARQRVAVHFARDVVIARARSRGSAGGPRRAAADR